LSKIADSAFSPATQSMLTKEAPIIYSASADCQ